MAHDGEPQEDLGDGGEDGVPAEVQDPPTQIWPWQRDKVRRGVVATDDGIDGQGSSANGLRQPGRKPATVSCGYIWRSSILCSIHLELNLNVPLAGTHQLTHS